jgi:surface polysaccharide O-acyltransferase-like enzyme
MDYLDSLRAIAIVMVVSIHAKAYCSLEGATLDVVSFVVQPVAVPIFFLCDGLLFSFKASRQASFHYGDYVFRSAQRLLLPWLLFTVAYTVARGLFEWRGILTEHVVLGRPALEVGGAMYGSGIAPQMYFLVSLFLIRCLSPLVRMLAAKPSAMCLSIFVGYTIAFRLIEPSLKALFAYPLDPIVHAFWGLQYYLLGIVLARHHDWLGRRAPLLGTIAITVLVALLVADARSSIVNAFVTYSYLLALYFGIMVLPHYGGLSVSVGRQSMGIYLLHTPILLKGVAMVLGSLMADGLAHYIAAVVVVTTISFGVSLLIERTPSLRFAFGVFERPTPP